VDFGTLSVGVSIVDSSRGLLGSALSEYPLHQRRDDPDYSTQSHDDHMHALVEATHQALATSNIPGENARPGHPEAAMGSMSEIVLRQLSS